MTTSSKRLKRFFWLLLAAGFVSVGAAAFMLDRLNIPPRQLAPYLERRAEGHQPAVVELAVRLTDGLQQLDRGTRELHTPQRWNIGAGAVATKTSGAGAEVVMVSTAVELKQALAQARPGQAITLMPGHYRIDGDGSLDIRQAGTAEAPIVVRAERPATVFIELNAGEGFKVDAPYWSFENLNIEGVCQTQEFCQHAFHVAGRGAHFTARNNLIVNFNAHFKINGEDGNFPDYGVIEGNTLTNTAPRRTISPVTPIDLVAASHWRIARNQISDFIKADGDRISYGAFVKGGGSDNRIEQNIVLCEYLLQGNRGAQVGLSLGGGGTGPQYCRDRRCITEQDGGVVQSNLIASCSDDGIYLNRAAASKILHNTLVDTGGITVRFPESSADVEGNLVDSVVRSRDEGLLRTAETQVTGPISLYLGRHPVRALFKAPGALDFSWKDKPAVRENMSEQIPDLCQGMRTGTVSYGAFEDFAACTRPQAR
ncbi:chondroitinase-B domain-containing protein [Herbaspirillum robiniae]|uniref:chondroitinase-B domain-containing protein n=1 Tax=Herbaspirillum robiniae TaxID=2014887 RepID=UPI003D771CDE